MSVAVEQSRDSLKNRRCTRRFKRFQQFINNYSNVDTNWDLNSLQITLFPLPSLTISLNTREIEITKRAERQGKKAFEAFRRNRNQPLVYTSTEKAFKLLINGKPLEGLDQLEAEFQIPASELEKLLKHLQSYVTSLPHNLKQKSTLFNSLL